MDIWHDKERLQTRRCPAITICKQPRTAALERPPEPVSLLAQHSGSHATICPRDQRRPGDKQASRTAICTARRFRCLMGIGGRQQLLLWMGAHLVWLCPPRKIKEMAIRGNIILRSRDHSHVRMRPRCPPNQVDVRRSRIPTTQTNSAMERQLLRHHQRRRTREVIRSNQTYPHPRLVYPRVCRPRRDTAG